MAEHIEKKPPPEEPTKRTGPDDPFEPVDPDDPLGITRHDNDPYVPHDPDPDPTLNGGIPTPPPVPPAVPADPPGRPDLRAKLQNFAARLSNIQSTEPPQYVERAQRTVQLGRNEFGAHWEAWVNTRIARERGRIGAEDEPDYDRLDKLKNTINTYPEFGKALSAWCRSRDAVPPDEAALALALDQATAMLDKLKLQLEAMGFEPDPNTISDPLDFQAMSIRMAAEAMLKCLADEAATIMTGTRISRSEPSAGPSEILFFGTSDWNFQNRLKTDKNWYSAGHILTMAIGQSTLAAPVTTTIGSLDFTRAQTELKSLDASLKARNSAKDPTDSAIQTQVYNDYLAVIDAHVEQLNKLRAAANDGSGGKMWSPEKLREATDLVVGMLQCVRNELAADPLVQDNNFAARTRQMLDSFEGFVGSSSLDVDAKALGPDLRKAWKRAKTAELAALKKAGIDTKKLSAAFDVGLGPTLDEWMTEVGKFPGQDRDKMRQLTGKAAEQITFYRASVAALADSKRSSRLVRALDTISVAMMQKLRTYDAQGGMF